MFTTHTPTKYNKKISRVRIDMLAESQSKGCELARQIDGIVRQRGFAKGTLLEERLVTQSCPRLMLNVGFVACH